MKAFVAGTVPKLYEGGVLNGYTLVSTEGLPPRPYFSLAVGCDCLVMNEAYLTDGQEITLYNVARLCHIPIFERSAFFCGRLKLL